jgi:hypothetical protein
MFLDGAARFGGIVAESEAIWQPGGRGEDFQRLGSRLVYDDLSNLVRWTAGDLQTISRGFQSAPDIAGLSVFRSTACCSRSRSFGPRRRSFRLDRPATVEVQVNGQIVRRLQLQPGVFNLRDFPFTQGANDIRLNILDDAGRSEILRFNVFLDQSQLAKGLTEFGVYAGVMAPLAEFGPEYSDDPTITGFVRHGLSDFATVGGNFQADEKTQMGGVEASSRRGSARSQPTSPSPISTVLARGTPPRHLPTPHPAVRRPRRLVEPVFRDALSQLRRSGNPHPQQPLQMEIGAVTRTLLATTFMAASTAAIRVGAMTSRTFGTCAARLAGGSPTA